MRVLLFCFVLLLAAFPAAAQTSTPTPYPTVDLTQAREVWPTLTYRPTSAATNIFGGLNNFAPTVVEMYARSAETGVQTYGEFETRNPSANWIWFFLITVLTLVILRQFFRMVKKMTPAEEKT